MINQWLRLWHDMPTDPKWRVIAKRCGRSIAEVMAVFNFILVNASCNDMKRGVTHNLFHDDIAAALDMETSDVSSIIQAMQGKVLDGDAVTGWEKRQPKREDSSSERVKEFRKRNVTQCNAVKRNVTQCNAREEKRREEKIKKERNIASDEAIVIAPPKPETDLPVLKEAFDGWNVLAAELNLPIAQVFDDKRRKALRCRLQECDGQTGWIACMDKIRNSPFLRGERDRFNGATFDWITKAENFRKIMEGNYDDRASGKQFSDEKRPKLTPTERTILAAISEDCRN